MSRSIPSWLPDGTAELLDDVISEVSEYIQGCNHLVIVEGFRCSLAEKKDSLEHVHGGLAYSCLDGSSFLLWVIIVFTVLFIFVLDSRFVRVNTFLAPGLSHSFPGLKLSARHQSFLEIMRMHPIWWLWSHSRLSCHCGGSSPVRLDNVHCQSFVQISSRVNGPCRWSRGSLVNMGLINRVNMVMGYKSNGRGRGGHLTWLSPPLFMVN